MKIGWIGCENMGRPMVANLLKGNYDVIVFDVAAANMEPLIALGAKAASSPKAVAQNSDCIFTMLPNGKILQNVVLDDESGVIGGLRKDKLLIDMSTVSPSESEAINTAVKDVCSGFLRAPVTGSTVLAEQATLGVFCSGGKENYEKALPLFKLIGNNQHYLGGGEQSRVLKLAINLMIAINLQMLGEAMLLIDKSGLDRKQAMEIIGKSAVGAPVINYKTGNVVNKNYAPAFNVAMMEKDLDLALNAANNYHVGIPLTALTRQYLGMIHSTENSDKDFAYLVQFMEDIMRK